MGANDRPAQELGNAIKNEAHPKFLTEIWPFESTTI
jgi:hypothetical protein